MSACGFEPSLAPGGAQAALAGRVLVAKPNDAREFIFVDELERILGPTDVPEYELQYVLSVRLSNAGITPDNVITRGEVNGRVAYRLIDGGTGLELTRGAVTAFTGYGTTGTTASTEFAREDAVQRALTILARDLVAELTANRAQWLS
ncbi:MAG: LPS assembly lipoprotein LptE [Pseudomonadota bacterium]